LEIKMNKEDILALADLTWEQFRTNEWSHLYVGRLNKGIPIIKLTNAKGGHAYWKMDDNGRRFVYKITIPNWIFAQADEFQTYYVVHELCHCIYGDHKTLFKNLEKSILAEWGIEIEYSRAYPKRLYSNGEMVYESWREKRKKRNKRC